MSRYGGLVAGTVSALLVVLFALAPVASAAPPGVGTLAQLGGTAGCLSFDGSSQAGAGTCAIATHGVDSADSVLVSPDERSVYVTTYAGELGVFSRNVLTGALSQLPGASGCFAATAGACTEARGVGDDEFGDGRDMVISPDGKWLYAVSQGGPGTVMIFRRDPSTGALTQQPGSAGCISSDGSSQDGPSSCLTDAKLDTPMGVSLSPDNRFLYVTDYGSPDRVHVFSRNTNTGALSDVQCISEAPAPSGCETARVVGDSQSLVVAPDGLYAYSGNYTNGLSIFDRQPSTGKLTQKAGVAGCVTDTGKDDTGAATCAVGRVVGGAYPLTLASNGKTLYVPAREDGGVAIFHVNSNGTLAQLVGSTGCISQDGKDGHGNATCAIGRDLKRPYGGAISPDGRTFYVDNDGTTPGGIDTLAVNPTTGGLTQFTGLGGCTTTDGTSDGTVGTAGQCATGRSLSDAYGLAVSPDSTSVYVAGDNSSGGGVAVFARQGAPVCQATSASATAHTPATIRLHCASPNGEPVTVAISRSPSHGHLSALNTAAQTVVYKAASGYAGADSFTYDATDGTNLSAPATASLTDRATAPVFIGRIRESAKRFREGKSHSRRTRKLPKSVTFRFTLDQSATVKLAFLKHSGGKRSHGRCVAPTRKNRHAKSCTRTVKAGNLRFRAKAGKNKLTFKGKLPKRHALKPGTYTVVLTATNSHRMTSRKHKLVFTIVKG